MSNPTYANIFNILKPIEAMTERKSGYFSFSASGKDQNLTFRLNFGRDDRGAIKYELLEEGERNALEPLMVAGRPNCIIDKDVTAIAEQMEVLEVSKGVTDVIVAIVEGLRRMEVVAPVFALNKAVDTKNTNRAEYVFGIAAYLLDDLYQPVGRISLSITVFKMSQLEKTANLIRKAHAERDAEEAGIAKDVVVTDGGNERYKITAMIQPGSPAMEQLMAKQNPETVQAVEEFAELVNNKLPLKLPLADIVDTEPREALSDQSPIAEPKMLDGYRLTEEGVRYRLTEAGVPTTLAPGELHFQPVDENGLILQGTVKANVPDEADPYTYGTESVSITPSLLYALHENTPKFNLTNAESGLDAENLSKLAEYTEQTKRLHITPDPTAEMGYTATVQNGDIGVVDKGYKLTDMHGDRGVIVPVSKD
jgi:hypothetical protein